MTAITVDTSRVQPVFEDRSDVRSYIAGEAITYGAPVFIKTTDGKIYLSGGDEAGIAVLAGYSLSNVAAGSAVDVLHKGQLPCFGISALAYGAAVYLADGGGLDTAAGTVSKVAGRVSPLSDPALTKVLEVDVDLTAVGAYGAGPA